MHDHSLAYNMYTFILEDINILYMHCGPVVEFYYKLYIMKYPKPFSNRINQILLHCYD